MIYRQLNKVDDTDIEHILSVYRLPSISRFISINEENFWSYVTTSPNVYFYKIYDNNVFIGTVHLELVDNVLYMDIVVFPEYQKKGFATKILEDIQDDKLGLNFEKISVSIDEKNSASINLFENAGFVYIGQEDELRDYEYVKC